MHGMRTFAMPLAAVAAACLALSAGLAGCRSRRDRETRSDQAAEPPPRPRRRVSPPPATRPSATATAPATRPQPKPWLQPKTTTLEGSFKAFVKVSSYPAVLVPEVEDLPEIDGEMDALYRQATALKFRNLADPKKPLVAPTTAYVITARREMYIFFDCVSPNADALKAEVGERDGPVWNDEAVEIFLDPTGSRTAPYLHVVINTLGVTYDARGRDRRWDRKWDPKLRVEVNRHAKGWKLEVALPFKELVDDPVWVNRTWAGNLTRLARLPEGNEESAWCPTGSGSSHVPLRFGTFWLAGGTVYATDFAKWTGPRAVYRKAPHPVFRAAPAPFELIRKCRSVTPSPDKTYCFGITTLPNNAEAVVVATEDAAATITSVHGWKPFQARWINNKLLLVRRQAREEEGYYGIYDVERRQIVFEELYEDGTAIWERLSGVKRPRPPKPVPWP